LRKVQHRDLAVLLLHLRSRRPIAIRGHRRNGLGSGSTDRTATAGRPSTPATCRPRLEQLSDRPGAPCHAFEACLLGQALCDGALTGVMSTPAVAKAAPAALKKSRRSTLELSFLCSFMEFRSERQAQRRSQTGNDT